MQPSMKGSDNLVNKNFEEANYQAFVDVPEPLGA